MTVLFVNAATLVGGSSGDQTITRPVEWTAGMLALLVAYTNSVNAIDSYPDPSWTLVYKQSWRVMVWSKVLTASEPSTYTVTKVGTGNLVVGGVAFASDENRPLFVDAVAGGTSSGTVVSWPTVTTTVHYGHLIGFGNFSGNRGHAPDPSFEEVWDALIATSQRVYALRTGLGAAGLSPTMTASDIIGNTLDAVTVAIAETDIPITSYEIADGHNQSRYDLTPLDPQPALEGVFVTRRTLGQTPTLQDDALYIPLRYSALEGIAQYHDLLEQYGVKDKLENDITLTARGRDQVWKRFNGTVVRPQLGQDGGWSDFFLRDVVFIVKDLSEAL